MKKFACEIKVGDRVVAGASDIFREVIRVESTGSWYTLYFINESGEEVQVSLSFHTEVEAMPTYKPRDLLVNCVRGSGVFQDNANYIARMDRFGNWSISGASGRVYDMERSMHGRLAHKTPGGAKFIFEPLD